jgi:hypothetical protein
VVLGGNWLTVMPGSSGADSAGSFVTPTVTKVKQRAATTAGKAGGGSKTLLRNAANRLRGNAGRAQGSAVDGAAGSKQPGDRPSVGDNIMRRISNGSAGLRTSTGSSDLTSDGGESADSTRTVTKRPPLNPGVDPRQRAVQLSVFCGFLTLYTWGSMMGRNNETLFLFKERLHGDVCRRIVADESARMGLQDRIDSVPDFQRWLATDFYEAFYSTKAPSEARVGFVHGQTVTVGSIRMSQLRARDYNCIAGRAAPVIVEDEEEQQKALISTSNSYLLNNDTQWRCFHPYEDSTKDETPFGQECPGDLTKHTTNTNASMVGRTCARACPGIGLFTASASLPPTGKLCTNNDNSYTRWWDGASYKCSDIRGTYDAAAQSCDVGAVEKAYGFVPHKLSSAEASSGSGIGPLGSSFPASPHYVHLSPRNEIEFKSMLNMLYDAKWIDLKTRALTIDINFFNPNNHALAVTRISLELPVTGGLYSGCSSYIVTFERLYQPWEDKTRFAIELATIGIFAFYLFNEVKLMFVGDVKFRLRKDGRCRPRLLLCSACGGCDDPHFKNKVDGGAEKEEDEGNGSGSDSDSGCDLEAGDRSAVGVADGRKLRGRKGGRRSHADMAFETARRSKLSLRRGLRRLLHFTSFQGKRVCSITFWHWLRLVNLFSFVAMLFYRYRAMQRLPADVKVDYNSYSPDFRAASIDLVMSNNIQAFNIFLFFTELFEVMKYFQGKYIWVSGLLVLIVLAGEAAAHMLAFGAQLRHYRNYGESFKSLLKGLFGSYSFHELYDVGELVGPVMWVVYFVQTLFLVAFILHTLYQYLSKMIIDTSNDTNKEVGEQMMTFGENMISGVLEKVKGRVEPLLHALDRKDSDSDRRRGQSDAVDDGGRTRLDSRGRPVQRRGGSIMNWGRGNRSPNVVGLCGPQSYNSDGSPISVDERGSESAEAQSLCGSPDESGSGRTSSVSDSGSGGKRGFASRMGNRMSVIFRRRGDSHDLGGDQLAPPALAIAGGARMGHNGPPSPLAHGGLGPSAIDAKDGSVSSGSGQEGLLSRVSEGSFDDGSGRDTPVTTDSGESTQVSAGAAAKSPVRVGALERVLTTTKLVGDGDTISPRSSLVIAEHRGKDSSTARLFGTAKLPSSTSPHGVGLSIAPLPPHIDEKAFLGLSPTSKALRRKRVSLSDSEKYVEEDSFSVNQVRGGGVQRRGSIVGSRVKAGGSGLASPVSPSESHDGSDGGGGGDGHGGGAGRSRGMWKHVDDATAPQTGEVVRSRVAHSFANIREMWAGGSSPRTIKAGVKNEIQGVFTSFLTAQVQHHGFRSKEDAQNSFKSVRSNISSASPDAPGTAGLHDDRAQGGQLVSSIDRRRWEKQQRRRLSLEKAGAGSDKLVADAAFNAAAEETKKALEIFEASRTPRPLSGTFTVAATCVAAASGEAALAVVLGDENAKVTAQAAADAINSSIAAAPPAPPLGTAADANADEEADVEQRESFFTRRVREGETAQAAQQPNEVVSGKGTETQEVDGQQQEGNEEEEEEEEEGEGGQPADKCQDSTMAALDQLADAVEDETVIACLSSPTLPRRELRRRCSEESLQRASR